MTFASCVGSIDHPAKGVALGIHVDRGEVIATLIVQIRLNRDNVEQLLPGTVLHRPQRRWVTGTGTFFA